MSMLSDIITALQKEMKTFWLNTNGNVILNTELRDDYEASFPLCIINIDSAPDSGRMPGVGATRMEWEFSLDCYVFEPNAYNSDDGGYSASLLKIIDDLRVFFQKEDWSTNEMKALLTNYGFRVTYNGSAPAPSLTIADKVCMGIKLEFITIAIDMNTADIVFPETNQNVSGGVKFVLPGTFDIPSPVAPVADAGGSIGIDTFIAKWEAVAGVRGYELDVATDLLFVNMLINGLDIGNNITKTINGLTSETDYYYRVRCYDDRLMSGNSNVIKVTTLSGS